MKITFLGVGGAFSQQYFHSNAVLEINGKRLLIDAGDDIRHSLKAVGLGVKDIDAVYVSHLHGDHCHGLEYLAFFNYFVLNKRVIPLFAAHKLLHPLWETLKHAVSGLWTKETPEAPEVKLQTFFDFSGVHSRQDYTQNTTYGFTFEGVEFALVPAIHTYERRRPMPVYGLAWKTENNVVYYSADSVVTERAREYCDAATIVFFDCETGKHRSGVHAHYEDHKSCPPEIRKKMRFYHYNDGILPDAVADGFAGFVKQGETIEI